MVKYKIYTKDGRCFECDVLKGDRAWVNRPNGQTYSFIQFYNNPIIAVEEVYNDDEIL